MKNSRSFKLLSRTSLINSPSSLTATTQVSKGVQYPPVTEEIYKTFSTKNANGMVINYEEYENYDTSSDISTKPIMSRQASAKAINKLKSKEILEQKKNNNDQYKSKNYLPLHNKRILSSKTSRNYTHNKQQIIQCTKECKKNILKNFPNYKYLSLSTLDRLTSNNLEIDFLKDKPLIQVQNFSNRKHQSLEITSRTRTPVSPLNKTPNKRPNKIFFANINKTKQNKFTNLISKLTLNHSENSSKDNKSKNVEQKREKSFEQNPNEFLSLKHFSIMNKFILKLVDPDEMIQEHTLEGNKPFDRFTKFKKMCAREKTRVCGLVNDLHKAPFVNKEQIKVYLSKIKKLKK